MAKAQRYSWWDKLRVSWVNVLIRRAYRGETLSLDELYLPADSSADGVFDEFQAAWEAAVAARKAQGKEYGDRGMLIRVLVQLWGRQYAVGGLFKLGWSCCVIVGAFYFVRSLLIFVDEKAVTEPYRETWTGWVLATGFFCAAMLWGAHHVYSHTFHHAFHLAASPGPLVATYAQAF